MPGRESEKDYQTDYRLRINQAKYGTTVEEEIFQSGSLTKGSDHNNQKADSYIKKLMV